MKKVEFLFDYLSPYSYLAWTQVRDHIDVIKGYGDLIITPVILSQIIHAHDTKGPAEIDSKRDFLMKDCLRYSVLNSVPFTVPQSLPFNSLEALRLSQTIAHSGESQIPFVDACFRYVWEHGFDMSDSEHMERYLSDKNITMPEIETKELRRELKKQVKEAFEKGVFGLPCFLVSDGENLELFWGNDSFDQFLMYLKGEDPLNREEYNKYLNLF